VAGSIRRRSSQAATAKAGRETSADTQSIVCSDPGVLVAPVTAWPFSHRRRRRGNAVAATSGAVSLTDRRPNRPSGH
jgi:hypothetical protein